MTSYSTAVFYVINVLGTNRPFISESRTVSCRVIYIYIYICKKDYSFLYLFVVYLTFLPAGKTIQLQMEDDKLGNK
jgi:hypothetical protein